MKTENKKVVVKKNKVYNLENKNSVSKRNSNTKERLLRDSKISKGID